MSDLAYYLTLEDWPLRSAAGLICNPPITANDDRVYRAPQELAAEEWLRASGLVIKIEREARNLLTSRPHSGIVHTLEGVRVADLVAELQSQKQVIWGQPLLDAYAALPGRAGRAEVGNTIQERRENAMRRYIRMHPAEAAKWTTLKQWHAALEAFFPALFGFSGDSFERFWKKRAQDLKEKVQLQDRSM